MGNLIRSEDRRGGTLEYVYDKLGRIREAKHSGGSVERFAFDPAGNILSANQPAATSAGRLKSQPQKTPSNPNLYVGNRLKEHNGTEYTYDGLGNLIYRQLPDGENQYFQYDSENQLVRAEIKKAAGNTEIWEYAYDPFGRRLSKERKDKLAWTSTEPKRIHFVWDGSRLAQEYTYKGTYTYIYTDQDSYEPLAQIFHNNKDGKQYLAYIHTDQIGIPREMTDQFGNLLWYGEYTAWGRLKKDGRVYQNAHQPFRLQNQYYDRETGLHYNLMRYYEPETGRFISQDPIGLWGGDNFYFFAPNTSKWLDVLGLNKNLPVPYWPPNRGALGEVRSITLPVGTLVDRYGYPGGTFVSPVGTPYSMRALPPGSNQKPYTIYRMLKPIDNVAASKIMPWFGEIGLGTQYELPKSVQSYIDSGHLEEVKIEKC